MDAMTLRQALACGRPSCPCGRGVNTHCPAHEDALPSLTVHDGDDGRLLVNCKTGCPQAAVMTVLRERGLWETDATEHSSQRGGRVMGKLAPGNVRPLLRRVAIYDYADPVAGLIAQKGRFETPDGRKSFKWRLPGADGWPGLDGKVQLADLPLWGAELVAAAPTAVPVWFMEGEKATQAGRDQGLLAVTHGGGASSTDFGTSLGVLTDRDVRLWPDNDEIGRKFMARIAAHLHGIARSTTLIEVPIPLPEKGDAADYFARGGTLAAIESALSPTEPVVDLLAHDAVQVRIPGPLGLVVFEFLEIEKRARAFECEVRVQMRGPGLRREPFAHRVDLDKLTQTTEFRRQLEVLFTKDGDWPHLFATAIARAREAWLGQQRAIRYVEIPDPGPLQFVVEPLLPAGVPTVWFGQGSAGKTYLAYYVALCVSLGLPVCGLPVRRTAVVVVDFENNDSKFRFRLRRLLLGLGLDPETDIDVYHWAARGMPFADHVAQLGRFITEHGIGLVIVDSAAPACGGKPSDEENALRYFLALSKLPGGVAILTLAHISKGSDTETPFGSIFWHNMSRSSWFIARVQEEESDEMDLGLYAKKSNDGPKSRALGLRVEFQGKDGPVSVQAGKLNEVPELNERRSLKWQVADVLKSGARTIFEIATAMMPDADEPARKRMVESIGGCLRRERGKLFVEIAGRVEAGRGQQGRWALRAAEGAEAV